MPGPNDPKKTHPHKIVEKGRDKKNKEVSSNLKRTSQKPPNLNLVYAAYFRGEVGHEEAVDLNPKFNPKKEYSQSPGKKKNQESEYKIYKRGSGGLIPKLHDIHHARKTGKITAEEAVNLNPKYAKSAKDPKRRKSLTATHSSKKIREEGRTPSMMDIHSAVTGGHITREEGGNLNSSYRTITPTNEIKLRHRIKAQSKQFKPLESD